MANNRRAMRLQAAVGLVMLIAAVVAPVASAQPATPTTGETVYQDPEGRFTIPIPAGWTAEPRDGYVVLHDPEGDITVTAIVVPGTDATRGIADAWAIVEPGFDATPPPNGVQTVPSNPGIDETVVITYDLGQTSGRVRQAVGQRVGSQVYVMIFQGSLQAAVRRAAQINVIASGFTITSLSAVNLAGVIPRRFSGELVTAFETYAQDLLRRSDVPGMAVAVVQGGQIVYEKGFGVTELGGQQPVTPDTLMMIGSVGKSLTTLMMATEVDDGLFTWNTPVISLYPSFAVADPELTRQITMRHLVCACSGVPRRDLELLFNARTLTPEAVIASLRDFAFYTGFGETFQYSNQMVAAAGYIAAAVASTERGDLQRAYADQLRQRVLEPAGMTRTTLDFDQVRADPNAATPHGATLDFAYAPLSLDLEATLLPVAPAGAHWSTANDMARYLLTEIQQGIAPGGQRVVSEANLLETWKPQVAVDAETSYGLGWLVGSYKGVKMIFHGGNTLGFSSDLAFLPDVGLGIVVLANGQGANLLTEGLRYRLLELVYDQPAEFEKTITYAEEQGAKAQAELRAQLAETMDITSVRPFLGTYVNPALGEITLSLVGDALVLDAGEFQTALRVLKASPEGGAGFLAADPPVAGLVVTLRRADDGQPSVVIRSPSGFEEYTFEAIGVPEATPLATPLAGR